MFPHPLPLLGLAALVVTSLLDGCIPGQHLDASPVAGQVVDRATHRPIVDAQVVLNVSYPDREARTQTDQNGRFQLPGFRHVVFTPLPYAMYRAPTGFLEVSAAGYQPYARNEFFPNEDGSPGYLGHGSVREVHVALVRASHRQVSTHAN